MNVFINNEPKNTLNQQTVAGLLNELQLGNPKGLAVAINEEVIPKATWAHHLIRENDKIMIIRATQGG